MSDPTREAAFDLLFAVFERHRALEDALDTLPAIEVRDRAAAHRLAAAVLRRSASLDAAIEPWLNRAPPPAVRLVLRIGAAGLLLLDTPAHAAVATAVALVRSRGLPSFAGLVNAVLRRVAEAGPALLDGLDGPRLDTPGWLWSAWGSEARAIATAHLLEAPLDITLKPGAAPPPGGEALPTGSWRYAAGTRVADLTGYGEGRFWVQDAAACLPALALQPRPGERIADLCAAPGGKSAQIAASGADLVAVERDAGRLERLRDNFARLRLCADLVQGDALTWQPSAPLDAVLLDAPCSATGTIRRHPDVRHLKRPRDLAFLAAQQDALLDNAAAMLRPGGRLVYAVCSLQPEEGPDRVAAAVSRLKLRLNPIDLPALPEAVTGDGCLRTTPAMWPGRGGMDGFFVARMVRL